MSPTRRGRLRPPHPSTSPNSKPPRHNAGDHTPTLFRANSKREKNRHGNFTQSGFTLQANKQQPKQNNPPGNPQPTHYNPIPLHDRVTTDIRTEGGRGGRGPCLPHGEGACDPPIRPPYPIPNRPATTRVTIHLRSFDQTQKERKTDTGTPPKAAPLSKPTNNQPKTTPRGIHRYVTNPAINNQL